MSDYFDKAPIRVPVKLVDGQWEYFYGGGVPIKEGASGDLIVERHSIADAKFLAGLKKKSEHLILDQGAVLLVALTIRSQLDEPLRKYLRPASKLQLGDDYYFTPRRGETQFFPVSIGAPSAAVRKRRASEAGGVWLQLEGTRPKGIVVSSVLVPEFVSTTPLDSLNHAFTRLSEIYEPWRQAHTGSIYTRVLYQERSGKWYPLEVLRRAVEATGEQSLIRERWSAIAGSLIPGVQAS